MVRASAINRFWETENLDAHAILDTTGTPQRPNPGKQGLHVLLQISMEPEVPVELQEMRPARGEEIPKKTDSKKYRFQGYGYTADCEACASLSAGMAARPHTEDCKRRLYEELRKTEKTRKLLERADEQINEYMQDQEKQRGEENSKNNKSHEGTSGKPDGAAANPATSEAVPIVIDTPSGEGEAQ